MQIKRRSQRVIIGVGVILILATFLYPCWQRIDVHQYEKHIKTVPAGLRWEFMFRPPETGILYGNPRPTTKTYLRPFGSKLGKSELGKSELGTYYYRIHWELQIAQFLTILLVTGGLLWIYKKESAPKG